MDDADTLDERISPECPVEIQAILRAAWRHDRTVLKELLDGPGKANCRDPTTGETPLHAAIRGAGVSNGENESAGAKPSEAVRVVEQLMFSGAIWNDVDNHNETPGCVAWRLQQPTLYELMVQAGSRAEMLFAIMDGYEELGSDGEEEEGGGEDAEAEAVSDDDDNDDMAEAAEASRSYLDAHLTLTDGKLVDDAGNGVMMAWETDIMRRSVNALLGPVGTDASERRVLNIGFGLGIIDSLIAARHPAIHHIIEAHPDVLARIDAASAATEPQPDTFDTSDHANQFGVAWEEAGSTPGAHRMWRGRWQEICPRLLAQGEMYDAIYFDTFGEDYAALRRFFTDYIPGLLADNGVFGFFNGLGADRRICYDIYTRVVEMHLSEAGLDVTWQNIDVDLTDDGIDVAGKGAWEGIIRPYWTLDKYRLPVCTFLG